MISLLSGAAPQTGRLFPTVEAIVGSSETVHTGYIERAEHLPSERPYGPQPYRLVVRVKETLKGAKRASLDFKLTSSLPDFVLSNFASQKTMFLWMSPPKHWAIQDDLRKKMSAEYQSNPDWYWFRVYEPREMDRYVDYDSNVFLMDFRVAGNWKDLRDAAAKFAKKYPKAVELTGSAVPHSVARICGDPNAYAYVLFPIVPELKTFGRALERDPKRVVDAAVRRSKSVFVRPTLSDADIAALKDLGKNLAHQ